MRGRWAAAAVGAGVARSRASGQAEQQEAAHQREMEQLKAEQQKELERVKAESKPQQTSNEEDITQKLQKLADMKKQGILTDEEFQKMKMELLAKM